MSEVDYITKEQDCPNIANAWNEILSSMKVCDSTWWSGQITMSLRAERNANRWFRKSKIKHILHYGKQFTPKTSKLEI